MNKPELEVENIVSIRNNTSSKIELSKVSLQSKGYCVGEDDGSLLTHQFRRIKRTIINKAFTSESEKNRNLVLVTSPNEGEGKTFFSVNLALSIALELDTTVLLIDANVNKPSLNDALGIDPKNNGLMEYLTGEVGSIADVMLETSFKDLKVIPAGALHFRATELLASEKMKQLTEELALRYPDRLVIFDAPHLFGVNETAVLANLMGQAIITVESNKTQMEKLKSVKGIINSNVDVGLVLNKVLPKKAKQ